MREENGPGCVPSQDGRRGRKWRHGQRLLRRALSGLGLRNYTYCYAILSGEFFRAPANGLGSRTISRIRGHGPVQPASGSAVSRSSAAKNRANSSLERLVRRERYGRGCCAIEDNETRRTKLRRCSRAEIMKTGGALRHEPESRLHRSQMVSKRCP